MKKILFVTVLYCAAMSGLGYNLSDPTFVSLTKKTYTSLYEVKVFFKELGLEYLEQEEFTPGLKLPKNLKKDSFYLNDAEANAANTKKYHEKIHQKHRAPMQIKWISPEIGYGVFATKKIKKDDLIQVYTGVVDLKDNIPNKDYCWQYGVKTIDGKNVSCDAMHKGNEMRFVNHDDNPNVKFIYVLSGNWHICYVATRDILPGQQITVSYGKAYWNSRTKLSL
jgi:hypothetical protein